MLVIVHIMNVFKIFLRSLINFFILFVTDCLLEVSNS